MPNWAILRNCSFTLSLHTAVKSFNPYQFADKLFVFSFLRVVIHHTHSLNPKPSSSLLPAACHLSPVHLIFVWESSKTILGEGKCIDTKSRILCKANLQAVKSNQLTRPTFAENTLCSLHYAYVTWFSRAFSNTDNTFAHFRFPWACAVKLSIMYHEELTPLALLYADEA